MSALAHYPRLAAAITSMQLRMRPSPLEDEAYLEPACMVTWLQTTSAACDRLAAVTIVRVDLPEPVSKAMNPAIMDTLLASIGRSFPHLRCLRIDGIDRDDKDLGRAMFIAIGRRLPRIVELLLDWDCSSRRHHGRFWSFNIAGIDWAACLPRGLQKFTSEADLHHKLLQQLVLMPSLTEVAVRSLGNKVTEVKSGGCAWRILRIKSGFPSCQALARFTAPILLLHLHCNAPVVWRVGAAEEPVLVKAAAWLSQLRNCPKELCLSSGCSYNASPTAGVITSSLAPLSGQLVSLELSHWAVSEGTLDELAQALPNISKLTLQSCPISSGAWSRLASLTSVTELAIDGGGAVPLARIIEFASAILQREVVHRLLVMLRCLQG